MSYLRAGSNFSRLLRPITTGNSVALSTAADSNYDLCIIGAGAAGFAATARAWDYGKKVCVIEGSEAGGAGVRNGVLSRFYCF